MRRVRGLLRISLSYNILLLFSTDASIYVSFSPSYSAEVTITGGEFSAPNVRTGLQIEGTSAVVSGDNDTGRPSGSVILKGGKFSGKAYNHVTNTVYAPAAGYQWQAITDGDNLKWAVVPATR